MTHRLPDHPRRQSLQLRLIPWHRNVILTVLSSAFVVMAVAVVTVEIAYPRTQAGDSVPPVVDVNGLRPPTWPGHTRIDGPPSSSAPPVQARALPAVEPPVIYEPGSEPVPVPVTVYAPPPPPRVVVVPPPAPRVVVEQVVVPVEVEQPRQKHRKQWRRDETDTPTTTPVPVDETKTQQHQWCIEVICVQKGNNQGKEKIKQTHDRHRNDESSKKADTDDH